ATIDSSQLIKNTEWKLVDIPCNYSSQLITIPKDVIITISFYEEDYCQLIRIHNRGTAVSTDELGHLFDSFYRGSNSTNKEGNGLGLYICRQIMRKSGGDIFATIESDGMSFTLVLPFS
ncbi:MAG: sensor histidine kinase, partial [Clostridiales bacterium]|nr:sensor histidine kinase [Clostridiales bacterium]